MDGYAHCGNDDASELELGSCERALAFEYTGTTFVMISVIYVTLNFLSSRRITIDHITLQVTIVTYL